MGVVTATRLGAEPFTLVKEFIAPDGTANDRFGCSVAMDGDFILAGAGYQSTPTLVYRGAAYLFERNLSGLNHWRLRKQLFDAPMGSAWDDFGYSVSLSGDVLAIGALGKTVYVWGGAGASYFAERNLTGANQWGLTGPNNGTQELNAHEGVAVAVSGNTAVCGAYQKDVGANVDQGAAVVWMNTSLGGWGFVKTLVAPDGAANDRFGSKVAISGDVIAVGAPYADVGTNADQGAVYLFGRNAGGADQWGFIRKLTAGDGAAGDGFYYVSLSGTTLAVGAAGCDEGSHTDQGAVYLFERDAGGPNNWGQVRKLTASDGTTNDWLAVNAVSGDVLVAGAYPRRVGTNAAQGVACVFERHAGGTNNWGQTQQLIAPDGGPNDYFGQAVAVSGGLILVGAPTHTPGTNAYQGAAYLFARPAWEAGLGLAKLSNGFRVSVAGVPGTNYVLQCATNILGPWQPLTNWTAPLDGIFERIETNPPQPAAFYQALRN